ncbi:MAG: hypothetical protein QXJ52_06265 [Candidatus Korarchaeota archaeon]|nr:hypothetical protein [Thermoproteota archaeon]
MDLLFFLPKSLTHNIKHKLTARHTYRKTIITFNGIKRVKLHVYSVSKGLCEILGPLVVEYDERVFPRFRYGADVVLEIFKLREKEQFSFQDIVYILKDKYKWLGLNRCTVKRLYDFVTDIIINAIQGSDNDCELIKLVPDKLLLLIVPQNKKFIKSAHPSIPAAKKDVIFVSNSANSYLYKLITYIEHYLQDKQFQVKSLSKPNFKWNPQG